MEFQPPQQMPHALFSDRPSTSLTSWPRAKYIPYRTSLPGIKVDDVYSSSVPAPHIHSRPVTPPEDMNASLGSLGSAVYGSRTGLERYGPRPLEPVIPMPATTTTWSFLSSNRSQATSTANSSPDSQRSKTVTGDMGRLSPSRLDSVTPSQRIPHTIKAPQETISQLAAEITCLFWFENGATLDQIEGTAAHPSSPIALVPETAPAPAFRKWVSTLLSTTQVTQNVVLLALLFIYKLKRVNPGVKGRVGSEYRLLTVALMLGNKFLDDNTYTNKTWAEVSGIDVREVHTMEVEFLSNMRYGLFISESAWNEWHVQLGMFGTFINRAIKSLETSSRFGSMNGSSTFGPMTLPSPPSYQTQALPTWRYSQSEVSRTATPVLLPQIASTVVSPIGPLPDLDFRSSARKRAFDDEDQEPSAKRQLTNFHQQLPYPSRVPAPVSAPGTSTPLSHLTLPSLTIPSASNGSTPVQMAPQLPAPGSRAMSLVYPTSQQRHIPSSQPTSVPSIQTSLPQLSTAPYPDQSGQLSPYPISSNNSSPVSATAYHSRLSPSYFLAQRSSPYRPVRRVQTLLVPPHASSVNNAPRLMGLDQMQYHPIGKPLNERRIGHLPYMHHEAWPQTHQLNQWPVLPTPQPQVQQR